MKHIHHLKASWLFAATVAAVIVGEIVANVVCTALDIRCPAFAVGAICVGIVVGVVAALYDGCE